MGSDHSGIKAHCGANRNCNAFRRRFRIEPIRKGIPREFYPVVAIPGKGSRGRGRRRLSIRRRPSRRELLTTASDELSASGPFSAVASASAPATRVNNVPNRRCASPYEAPGLRLNVRSRCSESKQSGYPSQKIRRKAKNSGIE